MAGYADQLGQLISGKITGSVQQFASGAKGAFVSANPALFGPGLDKLQKILTSQFQKQRREDKEERQREKAFDEENTLEQRKLFTDMLKEQKKTNYWLEEILKAILKCCKCDCKEDSNKLLAAIGGITAALAAGLAGLYKVLDSIKNLLSGLRIPGAAGVAIPDLFSRLSKMLDEFAKALSRALASLKSLRIPDVQSSIYRATGSVAKLMNTVDREFAYTTRLFNDRMASVRRSIMMMQGLGELGKKPPPSLPRMGVPALPGITGSALTKLLERQLLRERVPARPTGLATTNALPRPTGIPATRPLGDLISRPTRTIPMRGLPPAISYSLSPVLNPINIDAINRQYAYAGRASAGGGGGGFSAGGGGGGFSAAGPARNFPIVPRRDFLPLPGMGGRGGDVIDVPFREIIEPSTSRSIVPVGPGRAGPSTIETPFAKPDGIMKSFSSQMSGVMNDIIKGILGLFDTVKTSMAGFFTELKNTKLVQALLPALRRIPIIGLIIDGILSVVEGIITAFNKDKVAETLGIDAYAVSMQNRISVGVGTAIGTFIGGLADLIVGLADYTLGNIIRRMFTDDETKTFTESVLEQDTFKNLLSDFFSTFIDNTIDMISGAFQVLIGAIDGVLTGNYHMLENGLELISDAIDDLYTPFDNWSMGIATSLVNSGSVILNGMTGFINDIVATLIDNVPFATDAWKAEKKKDLFIEPFKTDRVYTPRVSRKKQKAADLAANRKDIESESKRMAARAAKPSRPASADPTFTPSAGYSPMKIGGLNNLSPGQRQMADQIYNSFIAAGFSEAQAMGAVVNAFAESGFNPSAQNVTSREASYGLFQMNTQGGLGTGYDPRVLMDPMTNIQLAIAAAKKQPDFLNARTVEEATSAFTKTVMKPQYTDLRASERAANASTVLAALGIGGQPSPIEIQRQKDLDQQTSDIKLIADATSQSAKIDQQTYSDSISRVNTTALTSDQPKITVQPDTTGARVQVQTQEGVELTAENVTTQTQVLQQQHAQMTQIEQEKMQRDMYYFNERRALEAQFYGTMTNKLDQLIQVGMYGGRGGGGPASTSAGYNLANKYLGGKLSKILGPEFGAIATTLVGSYADQFIGTTLGAFLPETGGAGVNRAINAYLSGDKKGAVSELIYGFTGIPTDMRTLVGSQYGFGPNASMDFAKDLSTVLGQPFEKLFRIGETPGTAQRLLYGPDTQINTVTSNLNTATANLNKTTENLYSLTSGSAAPGMGGGTGVYYYDPGTGQKIFTSSPNMGGTRYPGGVNSATGRTYDQALANVKNFGVGIASQMATMKILESTGVKDPVLAMGLGTGLSGGLRYLGQTALTQGASFSLAGLGEGILSGFKGMFDPMALGNAIGGGLIKAASGKILSGTSIGAGMTSFGAGMKTPSMIGQPWMTTAGNLGAALGGVMAGFGTYGMSSMLSRGYNVKGVNEIAGVLGAINAFAPTAMASALGVGTSFAAGGLGGAAGALGFNPAGLLILGGAVLLNSLFGKKQKVTGSGIAGTLGEGSTDLQSYVDITTSRKFGGSSTRTEYSALDPKQLKFYRDTIDAIFKGVREGAEVLNLNKNAIDGFTKSVKINLQGLSNDAALKKIQNEFTKFTNEMLLAAYPGLDEFKIAIRQDKSGNDVFEDAIATFNRLIDATRFMNNQFEMLGYTLEDLALGLEGKDPLGIADFKYDLATVFGGETYEQQLENFQKATGNFFEIAYTEEEKLLYAQGQFQTALDQMAGVIAELNNVTTSEIQEKFASLFGETTEESIVNYRKMVDEYVETTGLATEEQRATWASLILGIDAFKTASDINLRLAEIQEEKEQKTVTFEEIAGKRPGDVLSMDGFAGSLVDASFVAGLSYQDTIFDATIDELTGKPVSGVSGDGTTGRTGEFLSADSASRGGADIDASTTVVDNSVKQVSAPRTTVVMNDDKVRDYHPILHHLTRHTLSSFMPGCR